MASISVEMSAWWSITSLVLAGILSARAAYAGCSTVDPAHGAWSQILSRWVSDGRVDYAGLQREGSASLAKYLETLSGTCAVDYARWTRDERIAFWVNAYNAFMVRQVLDHYPIASVRKIGWLPLAAFRRAYIPMEGLKGGTISLDDIEHRTLRSDFREPRIHFALVCAAKGCPPLRSEAYRGADLDRQLEDQGRKFLRDRTKNRFDPASGTLHLSSIFQWFRGDFEGAGESLQSFVARYLDDPRLSSREVRIEFLDYDWALND